MKLLRTFLAAAALVTFSALSVPSFAQEAQQKDQDRDRMKPAEATITGCLTKSDQGDGWVLADSQSGTKTNVMGAADFTKHANHTVKLIGAPSDDGKTFNVTKIEHVADTCQAK
jgi:hypothetical protein